MREHDEPTGTPGRDSRSDDTTGATGRDTRTRDADAGTTGPGGTSEAPRVAPDIETPAEGSAPDATPDPRAGIEREVGDLEDPDATRDGALPGRVGGGLAGG